ncbi:UvrD-helicase domain-containing protein [Ktedonosporobacter rubrisoli]|nr:UvrD-helicase domain-containing protein [Ktedonosporobacter rubrisoli]
MRTMAEDAARLLLQLYQKEHPDWHDNKTPLDELVSWLGLQVATFHPNDYPQGTYGFMDPDEDESLIWLRRDLPESFRRFTLAHELGHAILHCQVNERIRSVLGEDLRLQIEAEQLDGISHELPELSRLDPCHDYDVQEDMAGLIDREQFQEALGIGESYDPRSQRELAANIFASELLMPMARIRELYLNARYSPKELASRFAVSSSAMLNRLAGLLKPVLSPPEPVAVPALDLPANPSAAIAKKQYDEFQRAAIEAPTPALIVAGPGSGKTSTLIGRVEYIINTLAVPPAQILALTFSRKAAREMEERLQGVLAGPVPTVSTFHAFCANLLRQYGTYVGLRPDFMLIDEAEGYFLLRQVANDLRLRHYQMLHAPAYYFPDMLKAISRARDELISPQEYERLARTMLEKAQSEEEVQEAEKSLEVAHVYALYQAALERRGDTDFGGLLTLSIQLLQRNPAILQVQQQQFQHILVDEFQDVNRASSVLLRVLAGEERRVWVVGDANQAIYSFRGASPANISQFEVDFPGALVLPLSRNYRSRPDLVAIAESFRLHQLELGEEPGKNQPVRLTHAEAYVTLAQAEDEASELYGLIQDIRSRRAQGYAYQDMAILCRTRAQARKLTRVLAALGLPVLERGSLLEQEHVKDVLSLILLLTNPAGMGLVRAARQPEHQLSRDDLETLLITAREQRVAPMTLVMTAELPPTISESGRQALKRLADVLQSLLHAPDMWTLLAQYLLLETSLIRDQLRLVGQPQDSTLLADYDRLLQLAHHYDQQRTHTEQQAPAQQEELSAVTALVEHARGFLEYLSLLVLLRQDGNGRQGVEGGEGEAQDILRVMTVHASKGLEFPVVYMPGLAQYRFPIQPRPEPISHPRGMLPAESVGNAAHESGEACLFYVGVTRARDQLVLSYSEHYGKRKYAPSPYLIALEAGLPEERLTKLYWRMPAENELPAAERQVISSLQPSQRFIEAMGPATVTASSLEAYQRCPRQYVYSSLYHFSPDDDAYRLFWQATLRTVDELRRQMQASEENEESRQRTPQEAYTLYTRHWQALGGHTLPFAPMYEAHGREVVEALQHTLSAQEDVQWNVYSDFNVDVDGKTVRVTVDRVEQSMQSAPVKFVRARFGKRKDKPKAELREFLYALAYRQMYPGQNVELHSHNMSTGETVPITLSPRKEQGLQKKVKQSIEGLERNEYPAQPADPYRCPSCPFFFICPA